MASGHSLHIPYANRTHAACSTKPNAKQIMGSEQGERFRNQWVEDGKNEKSRKRREAHQDSGSAQARCPWIRTARSCFRPSPPEINKEARKSRRGKGERKKGGHETDLFVRVCKECVVAQEFDGHVLAERLQLDFIVLGVFSLL